MDQAGQELEVSDILRGHLAEYSKHHNLTKSQMRVMRAIKDCRTHRMGYHLRECDHCGHREWMFNSCKDRHCPKCQWAEQYQWVANRLAELPSAKYHHTIFTLPDNQLHYLIIMNKKVIYTIFFKAAADTLKTFASDPKHLGAVIGMIGVLHTWGETLNYHVHIHFLVTAGGLSKDGNRWITPKYGDKFLFPVRAMSLVFRGKFISLLKQAYKNGELVLSGKLAGIADPGAFAHFIKSLARHMFRVHSKPATQNPENVVKYLSIYMKRVAISNSRLEGIQEGKVVFRFKDNRDNGQVKRCRMTPHEFIRRFLNHILPDGFVRVRYFGLFAGKHRKDNLQKARALLGSLDHQPLSDENASLRCEVCHQGRMQVIVYFPQPLPLLWLCMMILSGRMTHYENTS
jgi:hypothetical protein